MEWKKSTRNNDFEGGHWLTSWKWEYCRKRFYFTLIQRKNCQVSFISLILLGGDENNDCFVIYLYMRLSIEWMNGFDRSSVLKAKKKHHSSLSAVVKRKLKTKSSKGGKKRKFVNKLLFFWSKTRNTQWWKRAGNKCR